MIIQHGDESLTVEPEQWRAMQDSGFFDQWKPAVDEPIKRGPGRPPKVNENAVEERL